jgi:hypothetical protein
VIDKTFALRDAVAAHAYIIPWGFSLLEQRVPTKSLPQLRVALGE